MLGLLFRWLEPRTRPEWYKRVVELEEQRRAQQEENERVRHLKEEAERIVQLEEEVERVRQLRNENERLRERLRQAGLDLDA